MNVTELKNMLKIAYENGNYSEVRRINKIALMNNIKIEDNKKNCSFYECKASVNVFYNGVWWCSNHANILINGGSNV